MAFIVQIYSLLDGIWSSYSPPLLVRKHLKAIPLLTIPQWEPALCWNAGNLQWNPIRLMVPPFFGACFISLLFATHSKAISQCNFPVYGWSFASLISALEVNYKKQLLPYLHLNHLIFHRQGSLIMFLFHIQIVHQNHRGTGTQRCRSHRWYSQLIVQPVSKI